MNNLYNHSRLGMRMNIKKLIASVVIALGAWMSIGAANAQSVTYLGNDVYAYNYGATTMNYNVTISNTNGYDASLSSTPWWGSQSTAQLFSAAAFNATPASNAQGGNFAYSIYTQPGGEPDYIDVMMVNISYAGYFGNNIADDINPYAVATQVSGGGVAPEMNASQIPQVGLLLGCLFFLFGRKKENTEPMLTA